MSSHSSLEHVKFDGYADSHSSFLRGNQVLSVGKLLKVKNFALRRGVWFRVLSRLERGVIDLTIKCVDSVKSLRLAGVLAAIVQKLQQATESLIERLTRTIGVPFAERISGIAVSWGNKTAKNWSSDLSFAAFLAVMKISDEHIECI